MGARCPILTASGILEKLLKEGTTEYRHTCGPESHLGASNPFHCIWCGCADRACVDVHHIMGDHDVSVAALWQNRAGQSKVSGQVPESRSNQLGI